MAEAEAARNLTPDTQRRALSLKAALNKVLPANPTVSSLSTHSMDGVAAPPGRLVGLKECPSDGDEAQVAGDTATAEQDVETTLLDVQTVAVKRLIATRQGARLHHLRRTERRSCRRTRTAPNRSKT